MLEIIKADIEQPKFHYTTQGSTLKLPLRMEEKDSPFVEFAKNVNTFLETAKTDETLKGTIRRINNKKGEYYLILKTYLIFSFKISNGPENV